MLLRDGGCYFIFGILIVGVDVLGGEGGGGKEGEEKKLVRGDSCEAKDETDFLKRSMCMCVHVCACNLLRRVSDVVRFNLHNTAVIQMHIELVVHTVILFQFAREACSNLDPHSCLPAVEVPWAEHEEAEEG